MAFSERSGINIVTYVAMILLLITVALKSVQEKRFIFDYRSVIFIIFILIIFISTLLGTKTFKMIKTTILLLGSLLIVFNSSLFFKKRTTFFYAFLIASFLFSLYFLIVYWKTIISFNIGRLGGYFGNENATGLNFFFAFSFCVFIAAFSKRKYFYAPSIYFLLLSLTSGSVKVIVSILIFLLIVFYFRFYDKKIFFLIFVFGLLSLFFLFLLIPGLETIKSRFISTFASLFSNSANGGSTYARSTYFNVAMDMGFEKPFLGNGFNSFAKYSGFGTYSHSNFSQLFCEYGIMGLVCFYLIFVVLAVYASRTKTALKKAIIYSFIAIHIFYSFTMVFYYDKILYVLFGFLFSLVPDNTISWNIFSKPNFVKIKQAFEYGIVSEKSFYNISI